MLVHIAPVSDLDDDDYKYVIANLVNKPIVTQPNTIELAGSLEPFDVQKLGIGMF